MKTLLLQVGSPGQSHSSLLPGSVQRGAAESALQQGLQQQHEDNHLPHLDSRLVAVFGQRGLPNAASAGSFGQV